MRCALHCMRIRAPPLAAAGFTACAAAALRILTSRLAPAAPALPHYLAERRHAQPAKSLQQASRGASRGISYTATTPLPRASSSYICWWHFAPPHSERHGMTHASKGRGEIPSATPRKRRGDKNLHTHALRFIRDKSAYEGPKEEDSGRRKSTPYPLSTPVAYLAAAPRILTRRLLPRFRAFARNAAHLPLSRILPRLGLA